MYTYNVINLVLMYIGLVCTTVIFFTAVLYIGMIPVRLFHAMCDGVYNWRHSK